VITRSFQHIIQAVNGKATGMNDVTKQIYGVSTDTRTLKKGNLFVPLDVGENFDGHQFAGKAFELGASLALWQKDRSNPPLNVPLIYVEDTLTALQDLARAYRRQLTTRVIAITGSNGKTTTKDMVAGILATTYRVHKTPGNLNNHIGLPLTILQMEENTEMAVFEMGMSGRYEIEFLSKLASPDAVIITNVGEAHLLQLGTRQEIAKAKLEILSGLKEDGLFIYNGDEPLLEQFMEAAEQPKSMLKFRFGSNADNDFYPTAMMQDHDGSYFQLNSEHSLNYFVPILGRHNIINALSAIAAGKFMGVSEADIVRGLRTMESTSMRIEQVPIANNGLILNDAYNASPTSVRAAIKLLTELKGFARKTIVLGDMLELGNEEVELHRSIGMELNPDEMDYVYTYGPLAKYIADEARKRFSAGRIKAFSDKSELIKQLQANVKANDLILVKGSRGMKLEEVVYALKEGVI